MCIFNGNGGECDQALTSRAHSEHSCFRLEWGREDAAAQVDLHDEANLRRATTQMPPFPREVT